MSSHSAPDLIPLPSPLKSCSPSTQDTPSGFSQADGLVTQTSMGALTQAGGSFTQGGAFTQQQAIGGGRGGNSQSFGLTGADGVVSQGDLGLGLGVGIGASQLGGGVPGTTAGAGGGFMTDFSQGGLGGLVMDDFLMMGGGAVGGAIGGTQSQYMDGLLSQADGAGLNMHHGGGGGGVVGFGEGGLFVDPETGDTYYGDVGLHEG